MTASNVFRPLSSAPVTTERRIAVFNVETGEEGYIDLRWVAGQLKTYGGVYREERTGGKVRQVVICANPILSP